MNNIQMTRQQAIKDREEKTMIYCGVCDRFFKRGRINDFVTPAPRLNVTVRL